MSFHVIDRTSPFLPKAFVEERFAFYGKALSGTPQLADRSKRGVNLTNEALRQQVIVDGHAPEEYRADTVRNLDAWYTAFDVNPGQKLYLAPKDRVRVW